MLASQGVFPSLHFNQRGSFGPPCVRVPAGGLSPVLATWHIRSKIRPFKRENSPNPPCKHRRVGVKSDLVNSIPLARMTLFSCYGEVFVMAGILTHLRRLKDGCLEALCSLDQTARFLLATANPSRPWPKQVRASCGKCPPTTTTHHSQAASETATYHQDRSRAPRLVGTARSDMETSPHHRSARYPAPLASGALPPVLEAEIKGLLPPAEGRRGNDRLDRRDGDEQSALGS